MQFANRKCISYNYYYYYLRWPPHTPNKHRKTRKMTKKINKKKKLRRLWLFCSSSSFSFSIFPFVTELNDDLNIFLTLAKLQQFNKNFKQINNNLCTQFFDVIKLRIYSNVQLCVQLHVLVKCDK